MPIRKIARILDAAGKDASRARTDAMSPEFRKAVSKDRRKALSEFTTVKHALRDRAKIESGKGKAAKAKPGARPPKR